MKKSEFSSKNWQHCREIVSHPLKVEVRRVKKRQILLPLQRQKTFARTNAFIRGLSPGKTTVEIMDASVKLGQF